MRKWDDSNYQRIVKDENIVSNSALGALENNSFIVNKNRTIKDIASIDNNCSYENLKSDWNHESDWLTIKDWKQDISYNQRLSMYYCLYHQLSLEEKML